MTIARAHLSTDQLSGVARAAFGDGRALSSVERLRGGSKKGVYRLILDDGTSGMAYVWNDNENYWPTFSEQSPPALADRPTSSGRPSSGPAHQPGVFAPASGLEEFRSAHSVLSGIGVRVPSLLLVDRTAELVPGDLAVLEDVRGGSLETLLERDPNRAQRALAKLGDAVRAMNASRRDNYGWVGHNDLERESSSGDARPIEVIVLERALGHLTASAARVARVAAVQEQLAQTLLERLAAVTPRSEYGLIHGELGPDHVLLDDRDEPVLIDIEGTKFFDVEWEHAFLELRFNENYPRLAVSGLDQNRLRLYRLAMYLSLVEGPLRLLDGDFPDREGMLRIVEDNIRRTLAELD